jgi:hypothetical protein
MIFRSCRQQQQQQQQQKHKQQQQQQQQQWQQQQQQLPAAFDSLKDVSLCDCIPYTAGDLNCTKTAVI